jgi:hypothetical protein
VLPWPCGKVQGWQQVRTRRQSTASWPNIFFKIIIIITYYCKTTRSPITCESAGVKFVGMTFHFQLMHRSYAMADKVCGQDFWYCHFQKRARRGRKPTQGENWFIFKSNDVRGQAIADCCLCLTGPFPSSADPLRFVA